MNGHGQQRVGAAAGLLVERPVEDRVVAGWRGVVDVPEVDHPVVQGGVARGTRLVDPDRHLVRLALEHELPMQGGRLPLEKQDHAPLGTRHSAGLVGDFPNRRVQVKLRMKSPVNRHQRLDLGDCLVKLLGADHAPGIHRKG